MSKLFRVRPRAEGVVGGPWPSNPLLRGLNESYPGVAQPSLQCVHPVSQPRYNVAEVKTTRGQNRDLRLRENATRSGTTG